MQKKLLLLLLLGAVALHSALASPSPESEDPETLNVKPGFYNIVLVPLNGPDGTLVPVDDSDPTLAAKPFFATSLERVKRYLTNVRYSHHRKMTAIETGQGGKVIETVLVRPDGTIERTTTTSGNAKVLRVEHTSHTTYEHELPSLQRRRLMTNRRYDRLMRRMRQQRN